MFLWDEGSEFAAPLESVWEFVSSGDRHAAAHQHRGVRRQQRSSTLGTYSWRQPFRGKPERFTMRWRSFHPVGIAYEVLEGPFAGSKFFLIYEPRGATTAVSVVGEFEAATIPAQELAGAVDEFFSLEFEQDRAALEAGLGTSPGLLRRLESEER